MEGEGGCVCTAPPRPWGCRAPHPLGSRGSARSGWVGKAGGARGAVHARVACQTRPAPPGVCGGAAWKRTLGAESRPRLGSEKYIYNRVLEGCSKGAQKVLKRESR